MIDPNSAQPRTAELLALAARLRQRIERANELGAELANDMQEWSRSGLTSQVAIADDRLSWEVRVEASEPPLDVWGQRFGDALHNLRSALDNLVWGLAKLDGAVPTQLKRIQFPVVAQASEWPKESKRIAALPDHVRGAIEAMQPFQRPIEELANDGLLMLHRLNIVDKHWLSFQPEVRPEELSHSYSVDFGGNENALLNVPPDVTLNADVFATGTTIFRQVTKTPILTVKGGWNVTARVVVIDEDGLAHGVTSLLAALVQYVPLVMDAVLAAALHPPEES